MSDTPRTDARIADMDGRHFLWSPCSWELVGTARQLERELAAMRERASNAEQSASDASHLAAELLARAERAESERDNMAANRSDDAAYMQVLKARLKDAEECIDTCARHWSWLPAVVGTILDAYRQKNPKQEG